MLFQAIPAIDCIITFLDHETRCESVCSRRGFLGQFNGTRSLPAGGQGYLAYTKNIGAFDNYNGVCVIRSDLFTKSAGQLGSRLITIPARTYRLDVFVACSPTSEFLTTSSELECIDFSRFKKILGGISSFTTALKDGSNFLTVVASNGESIENIAIAYAVGFTDLRQVRISGALVSVPDNGATAMLLGGALAGLGLVRRYLKR